MFRCRVPWPRRELVRRAPKRCRVAMSIDRPEEHGHAEEQIGGRRGHAARGHGTRHVRAQFRMSPAMMVRETQFVWRRVNGG